MSSSIDRNESERGTRVLVTGGTAGLGRALVREWVGRGARVAFIARDAERVARTAAELRGSVGIAGDVARKDQTYVLATQVLGALGGLDVLINNASSLGPVPLALLGDTACEDFEAALATNLVGPFRLTRALLGALAVAAHDRGGSVVVNVTSDAAVTPYARWGAYGASKAALLHMSKIWNEELAAERVRVLAVDPGDMDTALHALAVPDADRSTLLRPATSARRLADLVAAELAALRTTEPPERIRRAT
jgi:NAD(P)-dependent dehydrogenase (short-subunit alcohol dehydrogenase family)